jgi:acetyl esterase/lipase
MMRLIHVAFGLALTLATTSCTKKDVGAGEVPLTDSLPATSFVNLSYGDDSKQTLDVYLPANRGPRTRMLIIIHGGGWSGGDKSDFDSFITEFQTRLPEYALANLNYRLVNTSGNYFPTQENDISTAINYLKSKTSEYNISTDFVYLGISAGAHLALLQGYKHSSDVQPRGIISFFGPVDLEKLYPATGANIPTAIQTVMNATLQVNPEIFYQSSPINFVTPTVAPTLMLHGDNDNIVPIAQAYELRDKLEAAGVWNKLVVYPGQGHGWVGEDLIDSFQQVVGFVKGLEN